MKYRYAQANERKDQVKEITYEGSEDAQKNVRGRRR